MMKKLFIKLFKIKTRESDSSTEHVQNNNHEGESRPEIPMVSTSRLLSSYERARREEAVTFIHCLVGNIVEERFNKSQQKTFKGNKHFSAGTKVYCFPPLWGDGYEKIKVIGRHRKSRRLITIIVPSKHVTNWRVKTIYNPFIIRQMRPNTFIYSTEDHKKGMLNLATSLNSIIES